jgi:signal transduction histidine kinase
MMVKLFISSLLGIICTWIVIFFLSPQIGFSNSLFIGLIALLFISWQTDTMVTHVTGLLIIIPAIGYLVKTNQINHLANIESLLIFTMLALTGNYIIRKAENRTKIKQYQQQTEEYRRLYQQEARSRRKAQEEIKARDEFLAIVSHELKTPLATMLLQIQLVLHNIRNVSLANFSVDNLLKMLDNAERQSKRLSKMIGDLLNVSLITTGRIDLELQPTNLAEITKNVVDNFSERMQKEGYEVKLQINSPQINGSWDRIRIEQVITNLLTNAIKYGDKKPIAIVVGQTTTSALLSVADQGIGIPEEKKELIFARFARAVPAQKYDGLGVGLFITNQIITAHGGKIKVESKPNKGSRFTVELPLQPNSNQLLSTNN